MVKVLNNGYVSLLESMGGDEAVLRNARRCWKSEDKASPKSDEALLKHLLRSGHRSPFEAMVFTFDVKVPLFIARQWMRHRMGSFNEESLRYCVAEEDYYIPACLGDYDKSCWEKDNDIQFEVYRDWSGSLSKEQARAVLPLGIYTKYYWTVNGSSLMNFIQLRTDKHAQPEIQEYARAILEILTKSYLTFRLFKEIVLSENL